MINRDKRQRASRRAAPCGSQFPDRIVLGVGYPWAMGTGPYCEVAMRDDFIGGRNKRLKWPMALWSPDVPQYRLVLERVHPTNTQSCDNAAHAAGEGKIPCN